MARAEDSEWNMEEERIISLRKVAKDPCERSLAPSLFVLVPNFGMKQNFRNPCQLSIFIALDGVARVLRARSVLIPDRDGIAGPHPHR
jgi:hypothetical protein